MSRAIAGRLAKLEAIRRDADRLPYVVHPGKFDPAEYEAAGQCYVIAPEKCEAVEEWLMLYAPAAPGHLQ